jgi:hypothetical protein
MLEPTPAMRGIAAGTALLALLAGDGRASAQDPGERSGPRGAPEAVARAHALVEAMGAPGSGPGCAAFTSR